MSTCPSCGREVGSSATCPHCGANLKQRLRIRTFGLLAIIVAVLGLAVLIFFATRSPAPQIKIGQIDPNANYAYVQIDGVVSRGSNYSPASQSLTFWVRDDTGEIMAAAFRDQAQGLITTDRVPAPGDKISVQGALRVRDQVPSLTVESADTVQLTRATLDAPVRAIGTITLTDDLHGVTVRGSVRDIREPFDGLRLITLRDATGAIDVAIPADLESIVGATPPITIGDSISVVGTVTRFEDTPQIAVLHGADITPLSEAVALAKFIPLNEVTTALNGQWVRVQSVVATVTLGDKNTRLILRKGNDELIVLIWPDVWARLPQADLQPGAEITVQGAVNVFRDEVEVIPEIPADLDIVARPSVATVVAKPIGSITPDDVKALVATQGTVEDAKSFSLGTRYTMSDPSGTIVLLIWNDAIAPERQQALLSIGVTISVTGKIDEFNGQLEIAPRSAQDINVLAASATATPVPASTIAPTATVMPTATAGLAATLAPSATPAATRTPQAASTPAVSANAAPIGALTQEHVGQTFTVRAKVIDTSSFSAGFKFILDDGTGKIALTLFNDDYKFVPNRAGLNLGADVQVTARIAEYQGALELQPGAGRDVQILAPGSSASVPVTPINQLTKPGERVAIEGTLTDMKGFSAGQNLFVDDGTGNLRVTLFNNVLAYVPKANQLAPGVKVRVYGKTDFFGRMQLVPQLGYDVTIP